jgi:hypothetical protein
MFFEPEILSESIKLIEANFGINTEMIEILYRTDDNTYVIDYGYSIDFGREIIGQSYQEAINWIEAVLTLDEQNYNCYNNMYILLQLQLNQRMLVFVAIRWFPYRLHYIIFAHDFLFKLFFNIYYKTTSSFNL